MLLSMSEIDLDHRVGQPHRDDRRSELIAYENVHIHVKTVCDTHEICPSR